MFFVLSANHTAERKTPLHAAFLDWSTHTHTHGKFNYTLWQSWQANNWNFMLLGKAHHHINGWTDKMCHILLGPKFPLLSIQTDRENNLKETISVFHYMFFFGFFSNSLFTPLFSWHSVIYPRQVLNINQVFLRWNMIICKLVIIGSEKMWAAKCLV